TPDITYRRVFIGFCFLFLMLSAFALHPRLARPQLRMMLFGSWVVVQFFIASFFTFDLVPRVRAALAAYWGYVGIPVVGGDPSLKTFEKLKGWPLEGARVAVLSHSL